MARELLSMVQNESPFIHIEPSLQIQNGGVLYLVVKEIDVAAEVLGHDAPAQFRRLLGHVRHLEEHRARQVAALQQVEVDVHVVRGLPSALRLLLLRVLVLKTLGVPDSTKAEGNTGDVKEGGREEF